MTVVPATLPVAFTVAVVPFHVTVATPGLLLVNSTAPEDALFPSAVFAVIVALIVVLAFALPFATRKIVAFFLSSLMEEIALLDTVISFVTVFLLPSAAVAVTLYLPAFAVLLAVTFPLLLTVTPEFAGDTDHVTFLSDGAFSFTPPLNVSAKVMDFPLLNLELPVSCIAVTYCLIVSVKFADFPLPSFAVALIVTFPGNLAVTLPFLSTVASFVLLLVHVTSVTLPVVPSAFSTFNKEPTL